MPKAKISKFCICAWACLLSSSHGIAQSPPVIGQIIEQAKKTKLNESLPPKPVEPVAIPLPVTAKQLVTLPPPPVPETELIPPALWSLSGLNASLVAEVLIDDQIHRFRVARGVDLPGGWTVVAGDVTSLTLRNGKKVLTLFSSAPGTTGVEFPSLRKSRRIQADNMGDLQNALSSKGVSVDFLSTDPAAALPATPVDQARQAAASLPRKP